MSEPQRDVQQVIERLQWLCDRVQEQIPHHWTEGAKASDATHDRLACTDEFHSGCHKYALVETARRLAFFVASDVLAPDAQKTGV